MLTPYRESLSDRSDSKTEGSELTEKEQFCAAYQRLSEWYGSSLGESAAFTEAVETAIARLNRNRETQGLANVGKALFGANIDQLVLEYNQQPSDASDSSRVEAHDRTFLGLLGERVRRRMRAFSLADWNPAEEAKRTAFICTLEESIGGVQFATSVMKELMASKEAEAAKAAASVGVEESKASPSEERPDDGPAITAAAPLPVSGKPASTRASRFKIDDAALVRARNRAAETAAKNKLVELQEAKRELERLRQNYEAAQNADAKAKKGVDEVVKAEASEVLRQADAAYAGARRKHGNIAIDLLRIQQVLGERAGASAAATPTTPFIAAGAVAAPPLALGVASHDAR